MDKKAALLAAALAISATAATAEDITATARSQSSPVHRYLIERHFPAGVLAKLDAAGKAKVNLTNAKYGVTWVMSYSNADLTKTWCVYEGPSESAIRDAAKANGMTVDSIAEVPQTLTPM